MGQASSISEIRSRFGDPATVKQDLVLKQAVAKLVLIGEQVGVSPTQMIHLLECGMTVPELLEYVTLRENELS